MKKSYKGLIYWLIGFLAAMFSLSFLPIENTKLITNLCILMCTAGVTLLLYIVYRYDKIYWINGVMYEDAVKWSRQQRDRFTWRHFEVFGKFLCLHIVFALISHFFNFPLWIIITVPTIGLIITAISTIRIKPE